MDALYGKNMSKEELEWKQRKQIFMMDNILMIMVEVNKNQIWWNKGTIYLPSLDTVCTRSCDVMAYQSEVFDTFGTKKQQEY